MYIGDVNGKTEEQIARFRQLTYTCLEDVNTRDPQTTYFPTTTCKAGIMVALRFPT